MSEHKEVQNQQVEQAGEEVADLLAGLSNRISDTVESIAELADDVEESAKMRSKRSWTI